jgi:APA family basic amino acid/polyamine antiporter
LSVFWEELATNNVLAATVGIATIWLLTVVNIWGVRQSGVVQIITTIVKFVPLALIGVIGLFFIEVPISRHSAPTAARGADSASPQH